MTKNEYEIIKDILIESITELRKHGLFNQGIQEMNWYRSLMKLYKKEKCKRLNIESSREI